MRKFGRKEESRRAQTWLYRYDCIVNAAYPNISLQRCEWTNSLVTRHFSGSSPLQILNPVIINSSNQLYVLESSSSREEEGSKVLTAHYSSETGTMFNFQVEPGEQQDVS